MCNTVHTVFEHWKSRSGTSLLWTRNNREGLPETSPPPPPSPLQWQLYQTQTTSVLPVCLISSAFIFHHHPHLYSWVALCACYCTGAGGAGVSGWVMWTSQHPHTKNSCSSSNRRSSGLLKRWRQTTSWNSFYPAALQDVQALCLNAAPPRPPMLTYGTCNSFLGSEPVSS